MERLDDLVDPALHLPQPAETGPDPVVRDPFPRRWWQGLNRWFGGPVRVVIVLVVVLWCLYAIGQGVYLGEYAYTPVFVAIACAAAWILRVPQDT